MTNFEPSAWQNVVFRLLEHDGYLVMGSMRMMEVGEVMRDRFNGVPLEVVGRATEREALEQVALLNLWYGCELEVPEAPGYFYKTVMVAN